MEGGFYGTRGGMDTSQEDRLVNFLDQKKKGGTIDSGRWMGRNYLTLNLTKVGRGDRGAGIGETGDFSPKSCSSSGTGRGGHVRF